MILHCVKFDPRSGVSIPAKQFVAGVDGLLSEQVEKLFLVGILNEILKQLRTLIIDLPSFDLSDKRMLDVSI